MGHEVKVSMTHVSRSTELAFYLKNYLTYEYHTGIMSQYDLMCDLKINVGHCDLYVMGQ